MPVRGGRGGRGGSGGMGGRGGRGERERGITQKERIVHNKSAEKVIQWLVSCTECLPDIELIWLDLDTCSVRISSHLHSTADNRTKIQQFL